MTQRDRIAWFLQDDPEDIIRARIAEEPFSTYPVCKGDIDHVVGYVDRPALYQRLLNGRSFPLTDSKLIHKVLVVPERRPWPEVWGKFLHARKGTRLTSSQYS